MHFCLSLVLFGLLALGGPFVLQGQQAFYYNRPGGLDPLTVGMKNDQPMAVDWDADGRVDILQRNIYSTTYNQPWWGIFFFKNIGSSKLPRYAAPLRLTLQGRPIDDNYASTRWWIGTAMDTLIF